MANSELRQPPPPTFPSTHEQTPWWRGRASRVALTAAVIAFGVGLIAVRWDTYGEVITDAEPGWLIAAVGLLIVGNLLSTWLHAEILAARGTRLPPRQVAQLVLVPNVAKYIPGFVAQAATYYQIARRAGLDRRGLVVLWIEAMWTTLAVTSALGAGALLLVSTSVPLWLSAGILVISTTALVPQVRDRILCLVRLLPPGADGPGGLHLRPLLIAVAGVATLGLHGVALGRSIGATDLGFAEAVAAFAGGWVIGLLVFIFPGGIGPREVVASVLLAEFTSPTAAVVLVVISRFATILADVIAGTIALLLPGSRQAPQAASARIPGSTAAEATGG